MIPRLVERAEGSEPSGAGGFVSVDRFHSVEVQGHRGDRGNVPPGNTLASLRSALTLGVDTLEADMQIDGEGRVVSGMTTTCARAAARGQAPGPSPRL